MTDQDVGGYSVPGSGGSSPTTTIPNVAHQETTVNLGIGGSISFDFNVDNNPILDMFLVADQALVVRVFCRQSSTDVFRQVIADINVPATSPIANNPFASLRVPGSQARVQILNNSGVATTVLSAQVHARSI